MKTTQNVSISLDELQEILSRHFQNHVTGQLVKITPHYASQRLLPNLDDDGPDMILDSDDDYIPGEYTTQYLSGFNLSFE